MIRGKKKIKKNSKGILCVKETERLNYERLISQSESRNRWKNHSTKYYLKIHRKVADLESANFRFLMSIR